MIPRVWLPVVFVVAFVTAGPSAARAQSCPPPVSTFDLIQRGIFEQHSCTLDFCHGSSRAGGLDLRSGAAYDNLLNPDPGDEVIPGDPQESLLWLKMAAKTLRLRGVPGGPMPLSGLPLTSDELDGVQLWILAGAPRTGFVDGVAALITACPATSPDDNAPLPACSPDETDLLLPDLVADPPTDIRVLYSDKHRVIAFTTGIANTGVGPLIIQAATPATAPGETIDAVQVLLRADGSKCARRAGVIRFQEDAAHWAYTRTVDFELRKDDPYNGELVASGSKTAFCLLDTDPLNSRQVLPHQFEAHCTDNIGRMGISVGYKDVYDKVYPGQWLDLDNAANAGVDPGRYYLVNVANPERTLLEANDAREQNLSYRLVSVSLQPIVTPGSEPVPTPSATPTIVPPPQPTPSPARPAHAPHAPHAPANHAVHPPRAPHPPRVPGAAHPVHPASPVHPSNP